MSPGLDASVSMSAPEQSSRRSFREVVTFLAVGAVGFIIEVVILTALTSYAHWSPWQARIPSFLTAVMVTWALNRRHTFPNRGLSRSSLEAFFYAVIQSGGALVNLTIFGVCLAWMPQWRDIPVVPLAIGAVGGFVSNFLLSSKWLYARLRPGQAG